MLTKQQMQQEVNKAKDLLIEQGEDPQAYDFNSWAGDNSLSDYLKTEYNLVLRTMDEQATGIENLKEQEVRHKFYNPESVEWKEIAKSVKSVAIVGRSGTGKTALAYKVLEAFDKSIYVFRHPNPKLLNERGFKQLWDISYFEHLNDCVVWIDEPQLYISTYETKSNVVLMRILSLCRQRNITLIISTSDTRFITRGLESYFDVFLLKDIEFDLVKKGSIIKKIVKDNVYIIDDGFSLEVQEYIFYSRQFNQFRGKHTFNLPAYFDERHSKPYHIAKDSQKDCEKKTKR